MNIIIDITIRDVGFAVLYKPFNELNNLIHKLSDFRISRVLLQFKSIEILLKLRNIFLRNIGRRNTVFIRTVDNLIVNIGIVVNKRNIIPTMLQPITNEI